MHEEHDNFSFKIDENGIYTVPNGTELSDSPSSTREPTQSPITKKSNENEENENSGNERGGWSNGLEFLMSCIAMNVGLGNIWRFPFVAYENGGGAFLIPYIIVLIFLGRPMYYLEMCLGQFSSRGNVKMFERLAPSLKGVGFGQLIGVLCVSTYYCSLMAITLFYLVNSFTTDLPWSKCDPMWNTSEWSRNLTCLESNSKQQEVNNSISSSELWFRIVALKESYNIDNGIGAPGWQLTVCLLVSWIITFSVYAKGVQSSGKASYFLAIFPYVVLFSLLIRAVTLEGADTGILYFIKPEWQKLLSAKVWYSAVSQCFFSLNIGFGCVSMYASYNNFRHNVYRDAMVVTTMDTGTSLLAGFIIFGILGNLAHKLEVDVSDVIKSGGTGLAFVSYPEAIARFEFVPWLFAILFFLMLFVLGVGSLVALQGCAFTVILDAFPNTNLWIISSTTAILAFLVGLVYVTPGGQYIFTMVDFFGGTFIFYILNIIEICSISYWYGLENICLDIEFMLKRKTGPYWRICWGLIIPLVLVVVFLYFIATLEPLTYDSKPYPDSVIVWGWILLGFGVLQPLLWWFGTVACGVYKTGNYSEVIKATFKHSNWGPTNEKIRDEWIEFKNKKIQEKTQRLWFLDKLCTLVGK